MKKEEFDLSMKMTEILDRLITEIGLELPFLVAMVGINGSCMFFRYSQDQTGLKAEFITEHLEDSTLTLPINIMFVDAQGEAVRVFIQKPGEYEISDFVGHA